MVPILYIIFNRLEATKQSFDAIRQHRPKFLFIAADGPREGNIADMQKCKEVREWVLHHIDWDCEVKTLFQEKNLGCGRNPAGAISWFFEQVEEGIILEDDCIPSISFFTFCEELLEKYRNNTRIFVIGGINHQPNNNQIGNCSYYFSSYGHIWGWATWRRAWKYFSYDLSIYDNRKILKNLKKRFKGKQQIQYWFSIYIKYKQNTPQDIWDYQWAVAQWENNAINIIPNVNLITNIGFGEDATHTKHPIATVMGKQSETLNKIKHPKGRIVIYKNADLDSFYYFFQKKNKNKFRIFLKRIRDSIKYRIGI